MARRKKSLPDPVEVTITDLSHDGRGVARVEGKTVFVADALPGERVRMRYRSVRRSFDEGDVVEVLEPSAQRVAPRCPHFGTCGGCALQHLSTDAQIAHKQTVLQQNLARIGKVEAQRWLPPLQADQWGYRRKARLSVRYVPKKERVLVGFRERAGRFVCDMQLCHTLIPQVGMHLEALSELVASLELRDHIPQIEVAAGDHATILVFRHLQPISGADEEKLRAFQASSGLGVWLQSKGPDTVRPLDPPGDRLSFAVPEYELDVHFTPTHFVQVNAALNQRMIALAVDKLALQEHSRVLDLFCGLGNFTLPLARRCAAVVGVEGDAALVELARANAAQHQLQQAQFYVADLRQDQSNAPWLQQGFDRILIDPPRSGAAEVLPLIAALAPPRLVYISCHPGSLARDAGALVHEYGYRLVEAGVMDMFPHTAHVESIAVFEPGGKQSRTGGAA